MLDLSDFQFEILPDEDSVDGVGFGIHLDVSVDDGGFDPGTAEWATQDGQNPLDGTTMFGRDTLLGETWAWNAHINRQTVGEALQTLRALRKAWRARGILDEPGKMAVVRYQMEGERRRVYGRPRRFAAPPDNKILNGYIPVTMDFKTAVATSFDDLEQITTVNFVVDSDGGLRFPTRFPASPLPPGEREGSILVGGDAPTYPVFTADHQPVDHVGQPPLDVQRVPERRHHPDGRHPAVEAAHPGERAAGAGRARPATVHAGHDAIPGWT
jgi:hypothetical protein